MSLLKTDAICNQIYSEIETTITDWNSPPHLAIVMLGQQQASMKFVALKKKQAQKLGYNCSTFHLPDKTNKQHIIELIAELNSDKDITGIIVQLPLPPHLNAWEITNQICPQKDVDCLSASRMGQFLTGNHTIMPGTAQAISILCAHYSIETTGKNVAIIGASNLVGKPAAIWFLHQNATVTVCHQFTTNLQSIVSSADIIISATGQSDLITENWLNQNQIIIDIGIQIKDGKTIGDLDSSRLVQVVQHITPVPGGIGPLTVAVLMQNLAHLYLNQVKK